MTTRIPSESEPLKSTNNELMKYADKLGLKIKVIMRDQMVKYFKPLSEIIVNLQTSNQTGNHWVMMSRKYNIYYDSYGLPPILEAFHYLDNSF